MDEYKLYSISDNYIKYLRKTQDHVFSNKIENRVHERKYVGVVLYIKDYFYFAPLSSPKNSDYMIKDGKRIIRKSIIPIIRMVDNGRNGQELLGTIKLSNMIPVPMNELCVYDLNCEEDVRYKNLVFKEVNYIRKNKELIKRNAAILYRQKIAGDQSAGYITNTLDFKQLELLCSEFNRS